jgi:hypothetical protein
MYHLPSLPPPIPAPSLGFSLLNTNPKRVRLHGGQLAPVASDGTLLPLPKRPRLERGGHPRPADITHLTGNRRPAGPVAAPQPTPPPLSESQYQELCKYIDCDVTRLKEVGFAKLVDERRGRSDIHPKVHKLRHRAAGCSVTFTREVPT